MDEIEDKLALIARKRMGIETLKTRNSDMLDFHDVGVTNIRAALQEAYASGYAHGRERGIAETSLPVKTDETDRERGQDPAGWQ